MSTIAPFGVRRQIQISPGPFVPGHATAGPLGVTGNFLEEALDHPLWGVGVAGAGSLTSFIGAFTTDGPLSLLFAAVGAVSGYQAVRLLSEYVADLERIRAFEPPVTEV